MQRRVYFTLCLICLCTVILIDPAYAEQILLPQAEQAIALSDILKPSGDPITGSAGGFNYGMMLFNTLFVIGLGVIVMKHPWFAAWATRMKGELDAGHPPLKALWGAFRKNRPSPEFNKRQSVITRTDLSTSVEMTNRVSGDWLEHMDSKTLATGTQLHWIRIKGEEYVLTEGESHSQWLRLDTGETLAVEEVLMADMTEDQVEGAPPVQQLPDYLDADTTGLPPVKLTGSWPVR